MEIDPIEECDFLKSELKKLQNFPVKRILSNKINYYDEVQSVMYAFGDAEEPLEESVILMHTILENQMALLINSAENIMKLRKGKQISHEDVLFLMRKDKVLLKRLLHFLYVEDTKSNLLQNLKKIDCELKPENGKRIAKCLKYLAFIEKFPGDLTSVLKDESIVDHAFTKRLKRRALMADSMTEEEYGYFSEYTLRVTFSSKSTQETFKSWLQQSSSITTDITPLALSIIHFLARETVATIIDKALEIKSRKSGKKENIQFEDFNNPIDHFCKSEQHLNNLEKNPQLLSSGGFEQFSDERNNALKNFLTPVKLENKVTEKNIILDSSVDLQKKCNTPESQFDKQTAQQKSNIVETDSCSKNKSDFDSSLHISKRKLFNSHGGNLKKAKTNHDKCNNPDLDINLLATNESLRYSHDISKKTNQEFYFSLNFKEKKLSICSDGLKTFRVNTSSTSKKIAKKKIKIEEEDITRSCFVEYIDENDLRYLKKEDAGCTLLNGFSKHNGHVPFSTPSKMNSKVYWFPDEAITPLEIEAAFIHYQQPSAMSSFMQIQHFDPDLVKASLVCLASPDDDDII